MNDKKPEEKAIRQLEIMETMVDVYGEDSKSMMEDLEYFKKKVHRALRLDETTGKKNS